MPDTPTRQRILDVALDLFGTRGVDAVSLDEIARAVGVRKQTVLYWFESKDELVDAVLEQVASELLVVIDAAIRSAPDDPLDRVDAVVTRRVPSGRPASGAARAGARVSRLPTAHADRLRAHVQPLVDRCVDYLAHEMDAAAPSGRSGLDRRARVRDRHRHRHRARGVAGGADGEPTAAGLRRLRDELRAFLRAALAP
jgi:TetR/AcrR family transcriptional regulator